MVFHYASQHERQQLDLYTAAATHAGTRPSPILVWLHGGGWYEGSKADVPSTILQLRSAGYAIASVGYRLTIDANGAIAHPFPAQLDDSMAAIRWLRANAAAHNLDSSRIVAAGFSAGGYLAALLGLRAFFVFGGSGAAACSNPELAAAPLPASTSTCDGAAHVFWLMILTT